LTSRDFAFWLQGLFELGAPKALDERQTDLVKRHLAMVFIHEIDPSMGGPEEQRKLSEAHEDRMFEIQPDGSTKEITDPVRKQEAADRVRRQEVVCREIGTPRTSVSFNC
jgi:hypothetical protein